MTTRSVGPPPLDGQVVIRSGQAPDGIPYEVVAYASRSRRNLCVFVDFPQSDGSSGGGCEGGKNTNRLSLNLATFPVNPPPGDSTVPHLEGFAPRGTSRLTVRVVRAQKVLFKGKVALAPIPSVLERRVGLELGTSPTFFVRFLPKRLSAEDLVGGDVSIHLVARDADGNLIGQRSISEPERGDQAGRGSG